VIRNALESYREKFGKLGHLETGEEMRLMLSGTEGRYACDNGGGNGTV
jgi:hypothetical protein